MLDKIALFVNQINSIFTDNQIKLNETLHLQVDYRFLGLDKSRAQKLERFLNEQEILFGKRDYTFFASYDIYLPTAYSSVLLGILTRINNIVEK